MAKKQKIKMSKTGPITITAEALFDASKPRFNGYATGHGAHGHRGYDRNAMKRRSLDW